LKKVIITILIVSFLLTFNSSAVANDPVELTFVTGWSGHIYEVFEGFIEDFHEKQDDVRIDLIYGGAEMHAGQKVQAMIASGDTPDMHEIGAQYLATFADADVIVPMEEHFENDPDSSMDDFYDSQIHAWTYDDTFYTMPMYASVPVWAINVDMFEEKGIDTENLPETWDELLPVLETVQEDAGYGLIFTRTLWYYRVFLKQDGGNMLNMDGGRAGLATEAIFDQNIEGLRFWSSLQAEHEVASYLPRGQQTAVFFGEQAASALMSTSASEEYLIESDFEVKFAPIPYSPDYGEQRLPMGSISIANFRTTPEREAASWEFLSWLHEPEQRARWVMEVGNQSPSRVAAEMLEEEGFFEEYPHQQMFADQLEYTVVDPLHPRFSDIYNIFVDSVEPAFLGELDIETSIASGKEEADRVLQNYLEEIGVEEDVEDIEDWEKYIEELEDAENNE